MGAESGLALVLGGNAVLSGFMDRGFSVSPAPPLAEQKGERYVDVVRLIRRLLSPDGCAWDREQDFTTLGKFLLEETCEVLDALRDENWQGLREELGDLSFQVVFLSELAQRKGLFGPDDVFLDLIEKLVRRHPHVFGDVVADTKETVEANWETIKAEEKRLRPLLDNIPRSLPALDSARRISDRVATVGFDWEDFTGSRAKVQEELDELDEAVEARDLDAMEHELGDVLFALVNYARHVGLDPERALARTSLRFRTRFAHVEERVRSRHGDWPRKDGKATFGISLSEMESYWDEAKQREKNDRS